MGSPTCLEREDDADEGPNGNGVFGGGGGGMWAPVPALSPDARHAKILS